MNLMEVGRWTTIDPLADDPVQIGLSPYAYAWNDPSNTTDPDGRCPWCAIIGGVVELGSQVAVSVASGESLGEALINADYGDVAIAAVAGGLTGGLGNLAKGLKAARTLQLAIGSGGAAAEESAKAISNGENYTLGDAVTDAGLGIAGAAVAGKIEGVIEGTLNSLTNRADQATSDFIKSTRKLNRSSANANHRSRTRRRTYRRNQAKARAAARRMRSVVNTGHNAELLIRKEIPTAAGGVPGQSIGNAVRQKQEGEREENKL